MAQNDLRAKDILRGGFNQNVPGPSDVEIGRMMGISHGRVYQLRLSALKKIRQAVLADPELRDLALEIGCDLTEKRNR